ncbi:MAG: hypothetical protein FJZ00_02275 [Candidatus Sericytochromatia bacterium]|uniref:Uncharacterized protein n=1 Tax=Candidatus Tanganyikabacteria bacterium TaxID=2961651 RepID=A0A937X363_9BACT|nr:hypothetical protein [Candidatus Tanganyikabacteria bacterium]
MAGQLRRLFPDTASRRAVYWTRATGPAAPALDWLEARVKAGLFKSV